MCCLYRFTGVSRYKGKWEAYLSVANQHGNKIIKKFLGQFSNEVDAAVAADRARVLHVSGVHTCCQHTLCWACTVHEWQMHPWYNLLLQGTICFYWVQLAVTGYKLLLQDTTCCYSLYHRVHRCTTVTLNHIYKSHCVNM